MFIPQPVGPDEHGRHPKRATMNRVTVVIAFLANLAVAAAKTIAAVITGSASMFAEAAHSWADSGNQVFLLIAQRRSAQPKDTSHPLGYGREAYVWSMFAALGLFTVGAAVSIMNGILELLDPEPVSDYGVAYIVLGISAIFEGISFRQAVGEARSTAARYRTAPVGLVARGSNPTLRAVVAEDSAALIGIAIAVIAILLHQVTGDPVWDGIGSILIGILLGVVAVVLIQRNREFLVGMTPPARYRDAAGNALLARPDIERVTYLHLEFVGPERIYLVAAVDLVGDRPEGAVAELLRRIESEIEAGDNSVDTAVLTLSVHDEPSITFPPGPGRTDPP